MPTYSKIPNKLKGTYNVVAGNWVVWASGILDAGKVFQRLQKLESEKKSFPLMGYTTFQGKKYYYCRYGFFRNDGDEIYTKPKSK